MFKTLNLITRRLNIPLPNDIIRYIIKLLRTTRVPLKEEQPLHKKSYKQKYKRSIYKNAYTKNPFCY